MPTPATKDIPFTILLTLAVTLSFLSSSCKESNPPAGTPVPSVPQTAAPPAAPAPPVPAAPAPPAVPAGDLAGFAPDAVLSVTFKEINAKGYPMVTLKNLTGRDIETIRGGFRLSDADGNLLHATGLTIAIPGQLFLAADAEAENSPFGLNRKEDLMKRLAASPGDLTFSFHAEDITFLEK